MSIGGSKFPDLGPDMFLLEASCVWCLDEVWRRTGGWRSAFWVIRSGSRFSDLIFDSPRSRTDGAWVSLGLSRCGFACQISPVWCGGCWRVSICLGFLVLEMLASSHKPDLGGFFLPGRATVSKIMAVSRGVFWWHVKLETCGEIWFSGAGFSVPLVTSFLGFSWWWLFVGFLHFGVLEFNSLLLLSTSAC